MFSGTCYSQSSKLHKSPYQWPGELFRCIGLKKIVLMKQKSCVEMSTYWWVCNSCLSEIQFFSTEGHVDSFPPHPGIMPGHKQ